jgi:hypothetical protein
MLGRLGFSIAVLFALLTSGCAATSPNMHRLAEPDAMTSVPDFATVVFIRHSNLGYAISAKILEEHGDYVGDSLAKSAFLRRFAPGPHVFTIWAKEYTEALWADLAPGRTYYVEVAPTFGAISVHPHLIAVKPDTDAWKEVSGWLSRCDWYAVDIEGGRRDLQGRGQIIVDRLQDASDHLRARQGEDLEKRILRPEDGL